MAVGKLEMEPKMDRVGKEIDENIDTLFGKYYDKQPTVIVKKSRIGVVLKRDNSLAILYNNKGKFHKGKKYFPIEVRKLNGTGTEIKWMVAGSFSLL